MSNLIKKTLAAIAISSLCSSSFANNLGSVSQDESLSNTSLIIGSDNTLDETDGLSYQKTFAVIAADELGNPISDLDIDTSLKSIQYYQGDWVKSFDGDGNFLQWLMNTTASCASEDANGNGVLDPNEDLNLNEVLDPGLVAELLKDTTTDEDGRAILQLRYAKNFAAWVTVELNVRARGVDVGDTTNVILPILENDLTNENIKPAASPFGTGDTCASPDFVFDADIDADGITNAEDNCPTVANEMQWDKDKDGIGNECDNDIDGDGCANEIEDALGTKKWQFNSVPDVCIMPEGSDSDGDGVVDDVDNCPLTVNKGQWDKDGDAIGNACDDDIDGDGCANDIEAALGSKMWNAKSTPLDCTMPTGLDSDNDGVVDSADNCPNTVNPGQWDKDQDNIGNECDGDIDGDGYSNLDEEAAGTKVWNALPPYPDTGFVTAPFIYSIDNVINTVELADSSIYSVLNKTLEGTSEVTLRFNTPIVVTDEALENVIAVLNSVAYMSIDSVILSDDGRALTISFPESDIVSDNQKITIYLPRHEYKNTNGDTLITHSNGLNIGVSSDEIGEQHKSFYIQINLMTFPTTF